MTPSIAARLAVFLTASALCVRVAGTEARGHVIVSKQISAPVTSDLIVQGSPFYVTYTVINLGAEPAYSISVDDVFPPQSFEVREGAASHKEAELAPGANVTFGVTLVPRVAGVMTVGHADVRYRYRLPPDEAGPSDSNGSGEDDEDKEEDLLADAHSSSSTAHRKREILHPDVYARVTKQKGPTAVAATVLAAVLVLVPYYAHLQAAAANDAAAGKKSA